MDELERTPQEADEGREATESIERQALDDTTLDPRASIEQTGDIRQAEEIQEALTSMTARIDEQTQSELKAVVEPALPTSGGGEDTSRTAPAEGQLAPQIKRTIDDQQRVGQDKGLDQDFSLPGARVPGFTGLPGEDGPSSRGGGIGQPEGELGQAGLSIDEMLKGASGEFDGLPGEGKGLGAIHPKYGTGTGSPGSLVSEDGDSSEPLRDTKLQEFLEDEADRYMLGEMREAEYRMVSPIFNSGKDAESGEMADEILRQAREADKPEQVDDPEEPPDQQDENKMPRPDGDEGGSPKDVDPSEVDVPSDKVTDPAYTQGLSGGVGGFEETKHPGLVTDPAETQDSGKAPRQAATTSGAERVTDPSEPEEGGKDMGTRKG